MRAYHFQRSWTKGRIGRPLSSICATQWSASQVLQVSRAARRHKTPAPLSMIALESNEGPACNGGTVRWRPDRHNVKVRHASSRHSGSTTAAITTRSRKWSSTARFQDRSGVAWPGQDRRRARLFRRELLIIRVLTTNPAWVGTSRGLAVTLGQRRPRHQPTRPRCRLSMWDRGYHDRKLWKLDLPGEGQSSKVHDHEHD